MSKSEIPLLDMYRTMLTIRRFEERCNYLFMQGRIPSTLHLYIGQEAVATGVCAHLRPDDYALSTHRPHGHAIAKGVAPRTIMAELYAKSTGCCRAKGGSMHVGDIKVGMVPAIAIVGANIPIAAGMALATKRLGTDRVAVSFFGDGATNEGAFHEGMNMAAIWDLPVVFVCENNLYAASTSVSVSFKIEDIADRAAAYGMPGSRSDPRTYRSKDEEAMWEANDPIPTLGERLKDMGLATDETLAVIEREVESLIDEAVAFAEESPSPQPTDALKHVFYTQSQGEEG
jgi:TPP-dependent pyruvate/acetoin dehydrogenase alpha subunit